MSQQVMTRPVVRRIGPENARWDVRGNLLSALLGGEETGGRFALIEITERPGAAPPRHIHHREDELLYVIDGELTVEIGGETFAAPAGTAAYIPRGTAHGFAVETATVRLLVFVLPAGLEGAFLDTSRPAPSLEMPPEPDGAAFTDRRLRDLMARYGAEVIGPPVEPRRSAAAANGRP
jgi:quercetin dioxygenase-like cupin family protein